MTAAPPAWAPALANVLSGMALQRPVPLLSALSMFAGSQVSLEELIAFLTTAERNDPALTQLRITLSTWDDEEDLDAPTSDGSPTARQTRARRDACYRLLQLETAAEVLDGLVPIYGPAATVISRKFEPWYEQARRERTQVYWGDYERYLRDIRKWPADAIVGLDQATTDVVQRLSDPTRETIKQTKGLVVGYVQSGKTANFTGVIAKAIDAGYRLIIVLTGTIEILRAQTQRRLDMELVGVENILAGLDPDDPQVARELDYQQDRDWLAGRFVRHGPALDQPGVVRIQRVTTHHGDYKRLPQGLSARRFYKPERNKPLNHPDNLFRTDAYVAVVKKVAAPLRKLIADLTPIRGDLAQLPVLIIDDESDQASVDTTNPTRWNTTTAGDRNRTTINHLITDLLHTCPRAQYVGYTATPFANVFVDPDDARDLFPADFVLSLHRPPGYMGIQDFHDLDRSWDEEEKRTLAASNELAHVRPLHGDSTDDPERRDQELQEALDAWVLSGAIKKYREAHTSLTYRHHTDAGARIGPPSRPRRNRRGRPPLVEDLAVHHRRRGPPPQEPVRPRLPTGDGRPPRRPAGPGVHGPQASHRRGVRGDERRRRPRPGRQLRQDDHRPPT